ncbi:exodeoxyribonuclease V subunit gamma [Buchnera aphidicola (Formosaphis micheliae)]|uniref:exodeoxyribonuclease V subunit gamma n=1 Tax=Buchnera aphidicola TaxID=9 RepID=UPI0031CC7E0C
MFLIYQSHRFDVLIRQACKIMKDSPLTDPFKKEIFLVKNKETIKWIKILIADKLKISANIEFIDIHNFINKLLLNIIPQNTSPIIYHQSKMIWKIMTIIEKEKTKNLIINKNNSLLKKFQFASYIADLFDQYLIYRPDWIYNWEIDKNNLIYNTNEIWQKKLWKKLITSNKKNHKKFNFSHHYNFILQKIEEINFTYSLISNRFFVCDISYIPISYIQILYSLSKKYKTYLLMTTPYTNYKFFKKNSIQPTKNKFNKYSKKLFYDIYEQFHKLQQLHTINPILLSCGIWGYEYISMLLTKENKYINCDTPIKNDNLLQTIQKNILKNKNVPNEKKILSSKDQSISIHICNNIQREVEILHNNLLHTLNNDTTIFPKDIIIKSFKLNTYIPFINNVFNSHTADHYIPFVIFNELSDIDNEILFIFSKLLNLEKNRFSNKEIFIFLQCSLLRNKFDIQAKEVPILFKIIYNSGIRWGLNKKHLNELLLPNNITCTWEHGIQKIMLNYATNNKNTNFNKINLYNINNTLYTELICKMLKFIETLQKWKKKLSQPKSLKSWLPICNKMINDFFDSDKSNDNVLNDIQQKWTKIINNGIKCNYKKKISIAIIRIMLLSKKIKKNNNFSKIFSGPVIFSQFNTFLTIPFKVVYILGCNHDQFPKQQIFNQINLMQSHPRVCDPNSQYKNKFLFLETLLSVKKYLYISYIGNSIQNQKKFYPSIILEELTRYINDNFCLKNKKTLHIKNIKHDVISHLITLHTNTIIDKQNYIKNNSYKQNFYSEWIKIYCNEKKINSKKNKNLTVIINKEINFNNILFFWKNPIYYFFNNRLNIQFESSVLESTEQFTPNNLDCYKIRLYLLNYNSPFSNKNDIFKHLVQIGILSNNNFDYVYFEKQLNKIITLKNKMSTIDQSLMIKQKFNFKIKNYYLYGNLNNIYNNKLLDVKPKILHIHDGLLFWLKHLLYCYLGGNQSSKILGLNNSAWNFIPLDKNTAYMYLEKYISGYIQGSKKPILLIKSGMNWIKIVYDKNHQKISTNNMMNDQGYKTLLNTWNGNLYLSGEKNDPYIKKIIPILNQETIDIILKTSKKWLLPMLKTQC